MIDFCIARDDVTHILLSLEPLGDGLDRGTIAFLEGNNRFFDQSESGHGYRFFEQKTRAKEQVFEFG